MMLANANGVVMTKSLTAIEIAALNGDGSLQFGKPRSSITLDTEAEAILLLQCDEG